jgi:hypothetical protein
MRSLALRAILLAISAGGGLFVFFGQGPLWVFLAGAATALALYGLRESDRRLYGAVEIVFATLGLWNAAQRTHGPISAVLGDEVEAAHWLEILLQIGTSIYVLVRGLDNFGLAGLVRRAITKGGRPAAGDVETRPPRL